MNMNDLKPAGQLAQKFGVKCVTYGGPGSGKTPLLNTAPRPVLLAVEPGLLSMRDSKIPTWEGYQRPQIEDFIKWFFTSAEAKNFDTLGIDSISQLAEIILTDELKKNKDGRAAYGKMSIAVMDLINMLYYFPNKHIYLIAKQGVFDENGATMKKPYFPGQDLNVKVPHMYDLIMHLDNVTIPGVVGQQKALRCAPEFGIMARDRSGRLSQFEPPNLSALFAKATS